MYLRFILFLNLNFTIIYKFICKNTTYSVGYHPINIIVIYMCVCGYGCVIHIEYVCMGVYMYVSVYMCVRACVCTYVHVSVYACVYMCARKCMCLRACVCTYVHDK